MVWTYLASVCTSMKFLRKVLKHEKICKLRYLTNLAILVPQLLHETKRKKLYSDIVG